MKTNVSRSFVRFIRRNNATHLNRGHAWSVYKLGGRKAVLVLLGKGELVPIASYGSLLAPTLPASMPKGAAAKIAGYDDSRAGGGMIHIVLKSGFKFDTGLNIASVSTVKDAIAVMRTAVASQAA